ncbi:MAG: hypothetical protein PUB39_01240 [Eubacteriales bacterium]|nr:hypothetical protein [Eubacteriales bacterium]
MNSQLYKIEQARAVYDILTDEQKTAVGNYQKLVSAENTLISFRAKKYKDGSYSTTIRSGKIK